MQKRKRESEERDCKAGANASGKEGIKEPGTNDVISGRGDTINRHPGNVQFRKMVDERRRVYLTSHFKREKRLIAETIVASVRALNPPGRFLSKDPRSGLWFSIDDERAREKTLQALRENSKRIKAEIESEILKKRSESGSGLADNQRGQPAPQDPHAAPFHAPGWGYPYYHEYGHPAPPHPYGQPPMPPPPGYVQGYFAPGPYYGNAHPMPYTAANQEADNRGQANRGGHHPCCKHHGAQNGDNYSRSYGGEYSQPPPQDQQQRLQTRPYSEAQGNSEGPNQSSMSRNVSLSPEPEQNSAPDRPRPDLNGHLQQPVLQQMYPYSPSLPVKKYLPPPETLHRRNDSHTCNHHACCIQPSSKRPKRPSPLHCQHTDQSAPRGYPTPRQNYEEIYMQQQQHHNGMSFLPSPTSEPISPHMRRYTDQAASGYNSNTTAAGQSFAGLEGLMAPGEENFNGNIYMNDGERVEQFHFSPMMLMGGVPTAGISPRINLQPRAPKKA